MTRDNFEQQRAAKGDHDAVVTRRLTPSLPDPHAKFLCVKGSHRPRPLTRFECFEYAKRRGHGRRGHAPDD